MAPNVPIGWFRKVDKSFCRSIEHQTDVVGASRLWRTSRKGRLSSNMSEKSSQATKPNNAERNTVIKAFLTFYALNSATIELTVQLDAQKNCPLTP